MSSSRDRRDPGIGNRLRRQAWPLTIETLFGLHLVPAALAVYMVALTLWAATPRIFAVIPADPIFGTTAALAALAAIWPAFRPALLAGVTVAELGFSMTLLVSGSDLDVPREVELLGSSVHGTLWIIYVVVHISTEALVNLSGGRDR